MSYQIRMVADMLGVPKNTLIAWERRYGIVEPTRTEGGYRVYSDRDVAVLRRVQALLDQGYKIGEACQIVQQEPQSAPEGRFAPASTDREALRIVRQELEAALLTFDRDAAERIGVRLLTVPLEVVLDEVYFPLLRGVGSAWEEGRVSVVQEHFVTGWCREKLLLMLHGLLAAGGNAPEVVCATPPGEQHELGLLSLALRLAMRGFRVVYLGANVPTDGLVEHLNARRPLGLCLSLVHSRPEAELLAYLGELRRRIDPSVRIAVGGRAVAGLGTEVEGVTVGAASLPPWLEVGTRVV